MAAGMKIAIAAGIVLALVIAVAVALHFYIKKRAKKQSSGLALGIDWSYMAEGKAFDLRRIRRIASELVSGAQRFTRGYDESIFRYFCDYLDLLIIQDLHYMIDHRRGTPFLTEEGMPKDWGSRTLSEEEYDAMYARFSAILAEMLQHFEGSRNEDYSERKQKWHHHRAMEMLAVYYPFLWD